MIKTTVAYVSVDYDIKKFTCLQKLFKPNFKKIILPEYNFFLTAT